MNQEEIKQLSQLFIQHNANAEQAEKMARQLLKRAEQVADEKNIPRLEALQELLEITTRGLNGLGPA